MSRAIRKGCPRRFGRPERSYRCPQLVRLFRAWRKSEATPGISTARHRLCGGVVRLLDNHLGHATALVGECGVSGPLVDGTCRSCAVADRRRLFWHTVDRLGLPADLGINPGSGLPGPQLLSRPPKRPPRMPPTAPAAATLPDACAWCCVGR